MIKKFLFVFLGLMLLICGLSISPLWLNQCSHQYAEEEKTYLMQQRLELIEHNWEGIGELTPNELQEKTDEYRQRLDKAYIPCGTNDLPPEEKEEAARRRLGVLDLLYDSPGAFPLPVRLDLEFARRSHGLVQSYHFVGYTAFYIPILRAWGGGSGYYEICGFSSDCGPQQK